MDEEDRRRAKRSSLVCWLVGLVSVWKANDGRAGFIIALDDPLRYRALGEIKTIFKPYV
jgi:hypothetical protein